MPLKPCQKCHSQKEIPYQLDRCHVCLENSEASEQESLLNQVIEEFREDSEYFWDLVYQIRPDRRTQRKIQGLERDLVNANQIHQAKSQELEAQLQEQADTWSTRLADLREQERANKDSFRAQLQAKEREFELNQIQTRELQTNLTNTLKSLSDLQEQNRTLNQTNQDQTQRLLALEADKSELIKNLGAQKQKQLNQLQQEKSHLSQQITLIKEVLND